MEARNRMRWIWLIASALLLCGCTPSLQQKVRKEQVDEAAYNTQSRERESAERCSQMLPGSSEHMVCMLAASKPSSAKP